MESNPDQKQKFYLPFWLFSVSVCLCSSSGKKTPSMHHEHGCLMDVWSALQTDSHHQLLCVVKNINFFEKTKDGVQRNIPESHPDKDLAWMYFFLTSAKSEKCIKTRSEDSLHGIQKGGSSLFNKKKKWVIYNWPIFSLERIVSSFLLERQDGRKSFISGLTLCYLLGK